FEKQVISTARGLLPQVGFGQPRLIEGATFEDSSNCWKEGKLDRRRKLCVVSQCAIKMRTLLALKAPSGLLRQLQLLTTHVQIESLSLPNQFAAYVWWKID